MRFLLRLLAVLPSCDAMRCDAMRCADCFKTTVDVRTAQGSVASYPMRIYDRFANGGGCMLRH